MYVLLSTMDSGVILVLALLFQQKHSDLKMGQKWVIQGRLGGSVG